ncbi:MAG: fumarylacetoacetate hydrolase family protein, partial [Flavobacteriales bacterium]
LKRNGKVVQTGHDGQMIFPIEAIIANVQRYMRLEAGDLIFSGTPEGVGRIESGDRLEGFLLGELMFDLLVEHAKNPTSVM